jgi:hypothetical protein
MADDIARLGLAIDASQVQFANVLLDEFEKRAGAAGKTVGGATQQMTGGFAALRVALGQVGGATGATSAGFAGLGTILRTLGPVGITLGATIGTITFALNKAQNGAREFTAEMFRLEDAADMAGITVGQFQALRQAGEKAGASAEQVAGSVAKLTAAWTAAQEGEGELFKRLKELNPVWAEQISNARKLEEVVNILGRDVFPNVSGEMAITIGRLISMRSAGADMASVYQQMAGEGGLGAVEERMKRLGTIFGDDEITKAAKRHVEITEIERRTTEQWNSGMNKLWNTIRGLSASWLGLTEGTGLEAATRFNERVSRMTTPASEWNEDLRVRVEKEKVEELKKLWEDYGVTRRAAQKVTDEPIDGQAGGEGLATRLRREADEILERYNRVKKEVQEIQAVGEGKPATFADRFGAAGGGVAEQSKKNTTALEQEKTAEQKLMEQREESRKQLQKRVQEDDQRAQVLGDQISNAEKLEMAERKRQLAVIQGAKVREDELNTVREMERRQLSAADVALKTTLGVTNATEQERIKLEELDRVHLKVKLSAEEYAKAMGLIKKETEELIEQQEVRLSRFPQLVQMQQEMGNAFKQADKFATGTITSIGDTLGNVWSEQLGRGEEFRKKIAELNREGHTTQALWLTLGEQIAASLRKMVIEMLVLTPLAAAFKNTMSGFSGVSFSGLFGGGATVGGGSQGAVVGSEYTSRHTVDPAVFAGAPHFARGGIPGGGIPVIAHQGEGIFTPAQMRALGMMAGRGGAPEVHIHENAGGDRTTTKTSQGRGGRVRMDIYLRSIEDHIAARFEDPSSSVNQAAARAYGLDPARGAA